MSSLPAILAGACLLLAGLAVSFTSLDRARSLEDRRRQRFANILAAHATSKTSSGTSAIVLVREERDAVSFGGRLARLFGVASGRRDIYPAPVWVLMLICLGPAGAIGWLAAAVLGAIGWLALPVAWPLTSRWLLGWFKARRVGTLFKQFPDALAMIVRGVRVGIPVADTVRAVAAEAPQPTAAEFRRLSDELTIGVLLEEALRNMARRNQLQEYRFFATAMALQSQTGGRLSETLENLADTIRKRVMVRARGHALAAETRTSSTVLAVLPFIAFAGLMVLNPAYALLLFNSAAGHMVLAAVILLLGSGLFLMRSMISRALS